jgi:hypothetical protein
MIDLKNILARRRPAATSLLGLALDGSRLHGVWLKRVNGALQMQASFSVVLSLDPLTAAPELVGREIRNHLDAAEIRERRCVVALPLKWAMATHSALPPLADADIAGFLQIEAERSFPCDVATLVTATSYSQTASGQRYVAFLGVPRNQIATLEAVLRAAKLQPEFFSLGLPALQPADRDGTLAFAIGESHVALQVTCGGGVVALRSLEGAMESEGGRRTLRGDLVAREARVTLGQLPEELRATVRQVRVFGPSDLAQQLADEIQRRLAAMDLKVAVVSTYDPKEFGVQLPPAAPVSAAFSLAATQLVGRRTPFDFLPPKVSPWQQLSSRYATGKLRKAGVVVAGVLLLVVGAFGVQQLQLWRLRTRWADMQLKVGELEATQQKIRQYRPWFDESLRSLSILRQLTTSFPEDGVVTAKTVEIRDANLVTCTGTARDNAALLRTLEKLRRADNVSDLKVDRIQGKAPIQFTFDFRWVEGGNHAN